MATRHLRRSEDHELSAIWPVACTTRWCSMNAQCGKEFDKTDVRRLQVGLLLEAVIDKIRGTKCRRTIRTLWLNQWDKKETAKDLGVSEKAISVALCRFKKAAAGIVAAPEFQEVYERIFC